MVFTLLKILVFTVFNTPGPTSQDAETPSQPGFHPPHLLYIRRGLTRNNSEFRRPEMWAQSAPGTKFSIDTVLHIALPGQCVPWTTASL
jgi:hypothetical protein